MRAAARRFAEAARRGGPGKRRAAARRIRPAPLSGGGFVGVAIALVGLDHLSPPPLARVDDGVIIYDRDGEWLHAFTASDGRWRFRVDVGDVDPSFVERLIVIEDKRFRRHCGVDVAALARAVADLIRERRIVSGASTITMQTARLLAPRPRTVGAKIIEMLRALQLERRLSKDEILSLYLTLAPYGGNIEGVRAASLLYFGKEPARLTVAEQALLIAAPQAPEARRPDRAANRDAGRVQRARGRVLAALAAAGALSPSAAHEAAAAPAPTARRIFPRRAYHVAHEAAAAMRGGEARLSIKVDLQLEAERAVREHVRRLADGGRGAGGAPDAAAAAAMIVDVRDGAVLASVGSAGRGPPGGWEALTRPARAAGWVAEAIYLRDRV